MFIKSIFQSDVNKVDRYGLTPLLKACRDSNIERVKQLLAKGANVNLMGGLRNTPLAMSCKHGRNDIAKLLIENGANVNHHDSWGYMPLAYACDDQNNLDLELIKLLLEKGASITEVSTHRDRLAFYILYKAFCKKQIEVVDLAIKNGAKINDNHISMRLLFHAFNEGLDLEVLERMLQKGANVNVRGPDEEMLLFKTCSSNHQMAREMAELLIQYGAYDGDLLNPSNECKVEIKNLIKRYLFERYKDGLNPYGIEQLPLEKAKTEVGTYLAKFETDDAKNKALLRFISYTLSKGDYLKKDLCFFLINVYLDQYRDPKDMQKIQGIVPQKILSTAIDEREQNKWSMKKEAISKLKLGDEVKISSVPFFIDRALVSVRENQGAITAFLDYASCKV